MIKTNKTKSTKEGSNLISNIKPLISDHRGITLVALIITIIVMLILVGVSISIAINGGLFDTTKRVAKETEKAKNAEQELANGRIKIDGTWYDSIEDYSIGKISQVQGIVDLDKNNTKITYTPEGWTNGEVKVGIDASSVSTGYILKYSTDNITWRNYTEEITMSTNGTIYVKLVDSDGKEGGAVTANVSNIDTQVPSITADLTSPNQTTSSINLEIGVIDTLSGISKIEWYYKKSTDPESEYAKNKKTDEYKTMNGKEAGEKIEVTKTKNLSQLTKDSTYNIYAVIYDVAGNSVTTNVVDVKTMESLLGKSATIDGVKYKVLYEAGEQGEEVQLISANALESYSVYLGYQDGQIDWTDANVIAEADLDNNNTLNDLEKGIYSYNHAIETLNKKCESLVNKTNPDIVRVRSVGSNPKDPNNDTNTFYTSDFLANNPTNESGKYNGIGKKTDDNYLMDYNRMVELGLHKTENSQDYWMASRFVDEYADKLYFKIRYVFRTGAYRDCDLWHADTQMAVSSLSNNCGIRPVVYIRSNSLSKYLD